MARNIGEGTAHSMSVTSATTRKQVLGPLVISYLYEDHAWGGGGGGGGGLD